MSGLRGQPADRLRAGRRRWRARWVAFHRWLGLVAGAALVVVGLTGSLFVFYREIGEGLEPELRRVPARAGGQSAYRSWDELIGAAEAARPVGSHLGHITGPAHDAAAARFSFVVPGKTSEEDEARILCVDPYTAKVLGESRLDGHPVWRICSFLFDLHYSLKIPVVGGPLVAVLAIIGLGSLVSGIWLWWPGIHGLKSALTVRRSAGAVRVDFDVHRVAGIYFAPVLGAVLLSGVWMNLPEPFIAVVKSFSPGTRAGEADAPRSRTNGWPPLHVANVLAAVRLRYPEGRPNWVSLPEKPEDVFVVSLTEVPQRSLSCWSERTVSWDQFGGGMLRVEDVGHRRTAGETFLAWQWPLHSGKAFAWPGRLLVGAAGFVPMVLYVTGLRVWWVKRRTAARRVSAAGGTSS